MHFTSTQSCGLFHRLFSSECASCKAFSTEKETGNAMVNHFLQRPGKERGKEGKKEKSKRVAKRERKRGWRMFTLFSPMQIGGKGCGGIQSVHDVIDRRRRHNFKLSSGEWRAVKWVACKSSQVSSNLLARVVMRQLINSELSKDSNKRARWNGLIYWGLGRMA